VGEGRIVSREHIDNMMERAKNNLENELGEFIDNTLEYAKKEKKFIIQGLDLPELNAKISNRHVLVVIRGKNYKEDLMAIKSYIKEMNPVLIGVDGGADALLECGLIPDLVIGDMDSVSDKCLRVSKEIIVHGYVNGRAPGYDRVASLNLKGKIIYAPGTSEDIALLLAHQMGAELIVAVGSHSNMIDFLEKGRKGMASTFLSRLKIGSILIDAKGVSQLYTNHIKPRYIVGLIISAFLPLAIVLALSTPLQQLFRLFQIRLRLMMGL